MGILLVAATALMAQEAWFPFPMPQLEADPGITNLSSWNQAPAGASGPVQVAEGHVVDGEGRRIRFLGTNLCFDACFPSHASAEKLAARLARLGVNLVRLHHTDTAAFPRGIWDPEDKTRRTLHPEALDRFDYLVAQLIKQGIYVNVNLHVGRAPSEADPSPEPEKLPKYGKGVDNFWRPLIDIQKWYARALLDRVNPYTAREYTEEPGVAFVEISNEDSLMTCWLRSDGIDNLPKPYLDYLDKRWQEWIKDHYDITEKLRKAWSVGEEPLGEELTTNGDLHAGLQGWGGESIAPCEMTIQLTDEGPRGARAIKASITRTDEVTWHGQVHYKPFSVRAGAAYTVKLWLRAEPARTLTVNAMRSQPPWTRLGLDQRLSVGPEWRQYTLTFRATQDTDDARVTVSSLAGVLGSVWISGLSVRPGGLVGLPEGQSLEAGNLTRLSVTDFGGRTPAAVRDQCRFYLELERAYWQEMYDFLKRDLGVLSLVTGTQITYSPYFTQTMMDYVDAHSYWQHPAFPGNPWDPRNWFVRNVSMVADPPGTLGRLIPHRIEGKPYTVSEYNHPAPNQYGGEAFILLGAYAAFQDWDAIYSFNYSSRDEWESNKVNGYFEVKSHPAQLVSFPFAAAVIRRSDVAVARELLAPTASVDDALEQAAAKKTSVDAIAAGVTSADLLQHRVALRWGEKSQPVQSQAAADSRRFEADTGELVWNASGQGQEVVLVRAPRAKALTGFCCGRKYDLGHGVRMEVGENSLGWAAITLVQLKGDQIGGAGDLLITAAGAYRNQGWGWQDLGQNRITLGPNWGAGPVEMEGITARLVLPVAVPRLTVRALDEKGQPRHSVVVRQAEECSMVEIGPQYKTLWYHVSVTE